MGKYISCGKFNNYFYYIIFTFFFDLLNDALYGFNYIDMFNEMKIIKSDTQNYFSWHHLIHQIFNYFGTFVFAYCFEKYEIRSSRREQERLSPNPPTPDNNNNIQIILIHNDIDDLDDHQYSNNWMILLIIFLWVLEEQLIDIYSYALKDLDFWMVELIIITYLNAFMFKKEIYKHQKFAIWITILPCLLKILTIVLSLLDDKEEIKDDKEPILYSLHKILIPIGIIIYLILITLRSYVNTKIKWFMDLKYISHNRLLIYYGFWGTLFCTIISTMSTFIPCNDNKNEIEISDYICKIPYKDPNSNSSNYEHKYLESFIFYFQTFEGKIGKNFKKTEIFIEIVIIISGLVTFFFEKYFSVLIIKNLTPVHLIFSYPMFYFFQKMVLVLYNVGKRQLEIKSEKKFLIPKFILDTSGDLISFFGFLIYLEMIELKCGKYDYNIKKNITRRSFGESYGIHENKKKHLINSNNNTINSINTTSDNEEEEGEEDESEFTLN